MMPFFYIFTLMNNYNLNNNGNGINQNNGGIKPTISPVGAAALGLVAVFFLYHIVGSLLTLAIVGFDVKNADMNSIRLLTVGGQILFILFPALLFSKMFYEDVATIIRFRLPSLKETITYVVGLAILSILLQNFIYLQNTAFNWLSSNYSFFMQFKELLDQLDKLVEESYLGLLKYDSLFEASFIVFVVSMVPAICEEIFFRGYVQKSFEFKVKPWASMIITAFFFSMYHFNPYGFFALFGLGAFFGFAAYYSRSIFIPILLHFLNNFITVIVYFLYGDDEMLKSNVIDGSDAGFHMVSFVIVSAAFVLFIRYIINNNKKT